MLVNGPPTAPMVRVKAWPPTAVKLWDKDIDGGLALALLFAYTLNPKSVASRRSIHSQERNDKTISQTEGSTIFFREDLEFKSGKNSALDKKSCITLKKLNRVVASQSGQENPLLEVQKKSAVSWWQRSEKCSWNARRLSSSHERIQKASVCCHKPERFAALAWWSPEAAATGSWGVGATSSFFSSLNWSALEDWSCLPSSPSSSSSSLGVGVMVVCTMRKLVSTRDATELLLLWMAESLTLSRLAAVFKNCCDFWSTDLKLSTRGEYKALQEKPKSTTDCFTALIGELRGTILQP